MMKWNDLIDQIMIENQGVAPLNLLYERASKYKDLPSGDWQKTLRGVLYRDVKRGRFKKVGLGVFAMQDYRNESSAYDFALKKKPAVRYLEKVKDTHSAIEGMLIEIGNFFDYKTYTSDANKSFDNKNLKDLCELHQIPEFTYKELKSIISKSDVIWFTKSKLPFPKYIYEVESTTDFTKSMLKMYQMVDFEAKFVLVASSKKKPIFDNRLEREPFDSVKDKFSFRSFDDVTKLYFSSVEHYELKSQFLG